ncbi:MAG: diguanylate cyclase [Acidiferrobacterales bacterium]
MRVTKIQLSLGVRQKMILILVAVLSIALGVTAWLTIGHQRRELVRQTEQHGQDLSRVVSRALAFSVIGYDYKTIQMILNELTRTHAVAYAQVTGTHGHVMAVAGNLTSENGQITLFQSDIMLVGRPVGRLVIGINTAPIVQEIRNAQTSLLTHEAVVILLIAIGEFSALSYLIIRPVSIITKSLEIGLSDNGLISTDIPLDSRDEFGNLARQFNALRAELNGANARLQEKIVVADRRLTATNEQLQSQATELKRVNIELERTAVTDPLTGLYNRRFFEKSLETDLALSTRHGDFNSLLLIDIDYFKKINDNYGHRSGDAVLCDIAEILKNGVRKSDVVSRYGGEEFLLLCRRTDKPQSIAAAEKLREAIARHEFRSVDGTLLHLTVSIGISTFPDRMAPNSGDDYLQRADIALYECKGAGRNQVRHFEDIPQKQTVHL